MQQEQTQTLMSFSCKIPYTSICKVITVPGNMTIAEVINYITNNLKYEMNIHERYNIEVVETYKNEYVRAELAPALEPTAQTLMERYGTPMTVTAFYVRPVDPVTGTFERRSNYIV